MQIQEQVILVTGASRGLGASIAKAFGKQGARVVINYFQSKEKAEKVVESIGENAIAIQADVRSAAQVKAMTDKAKSHFGQSINTIVNNALFDYKFDPVNKKNADNIAWENYQTQIDGTLKAALNTLKACLEDMKRENFGRLIMIGTNLFQNPVVPYHEYTTSKAALLGFSRNMANELGQHNITVNMVSGGLLKKTDASAVTSEEVFGIIEATTPLKRVTTPEEAADAVLFFASPWSRAITGQNINVDGGLVMT